MGENFNVNAVNGTAKLTIPIALSPARGGAQPSLVLDYSSGSGNGEYGLGWSIANSNITRKTDKGLPRYADGVGAQQDMDVFTFGGEDLVPRFERDTNGIVKVNEQGQPLVHEDEIGDWRVRKYQPRIEGSYTLIERWMSASTSGEIHWRCISKDNVTSIYGRDDNSRVFSRQNEITRIFSWLLSETYSPDGNAVLYTYKEEDGVGISLHTACEQNRQSEATSASRYLKSIKYGNLAPNRDMGSWKPFSPSILPPMDWMFSVVFDYGEHDPDIPTTGEVKTWPARQDAFSTFKSTFDIRTYRLCRRILLFHHFPSELGLEDYVVRATRLIYDENPVATLLTQVQEVGYMWTSETNSYIINELPPVELSYSRFPTEAELQKRLVRDIDPTSLENLPSGIDGSSYMLADLDGEGLQGIFFDSGPEWFYKRNFSANNFIGRDDQSTPSVTPRFGPIELVARRPPVDFSSGDCALLDINGNGRLDVLVRDEENWGYYERDTEEQSWYEFRSLNSYPRVDWKRPDVDLVDVTGDGLPDILVSLDDSFVLYPLLGEAGFGEPEIASKGVDEDFGPRLVRADPEQTIYLADMSGDGMQDLVRIRNSDVSYWPNLGYGKFGRKITMDNVPCFTHNDQLHHRNLLLTDIDGSGTTDILYIGAEGIEMFLNQSGNSFRNRIQLPIFPIHDSFSTVLACDLLGNGTTCIVWSTQLGHPSPMRYLDLLQGVKPHLLVTLANNLGAETRIHYATSTKFYLDDKAAGKPWITRLPFPVHCVERVEEFDHISQNRFEKRFAYHHGFFDGYEREFRGFAMVEQWDTQDFDVMQKSSSFGSTAANSEAKWHSPPVLVKSWFHTGAYIDNDKISRQLAHEYFGANTVTSGSQDDNFETFWDSLLPDTVIPPALSSSETREACRSLKGQLLRKEVYSADGSPQAELPYIVIESNYTILPLQSLLDIHDHGVFSTHQREVLTYNLDRKPDDARIQHELALELDEYGNTLKSLSIMYGRMPGQSTLSGPDFLAQESTLAEYNEYQWTNSVTDAENYLLPRLWETKAFQLHGFEMERPKDVNVERFTANDFELIKSLPLLSYEEQPTTQTKQKRLIDCYRSLFRSDDLASVLKPGEIQSRAIVSESYELALTAGLISKTFQRSKIDGTTESLLPNPQNILGGRSDSDGFYVDLENNGNWWIPSGRSFFHVDPASTPQQEESEAKAHFFEYRRTEDAAGGITTIFYDLYDLLPVRLVDPVLNTAEVNINYRVLQPDRLTDCNGNRSLCAYDELGHVIALAIGGKTTETIGDSLDNFQAVLDQQIINQLFQNPTGPIAATLLGNATTRTVYDTKCYWESVIGTPNDTSQKTPVWNATITREKHSSDKTLGSSRILVSFAYFDGYSNQIQGKVQAEPGPVVKDGPVMDPRWAGTGWTIFNNKGAPVKTFEPFFDDSHLFKFDQKVGVSSTMLYDPIGRVVATLHPNKSWTKAVFKVWEQIEWDMNDTSLISDPRLDPDIGPYFSRLPEGEFLPSWYDSRKNGQLGPEERSAALKTAAHANTPSRVHMDPMGRSIVSVIDNGADGYYYTHSRIDIRGNLLAVIDAKDRIVEKNVYDVLGNHIHCASMESGERWHLVDSLGMDIRRWDSRLQTFLCVSQKTDLPKSV
jgi:hypothetical protein